MKKSNKTDAEPPQNIFAVLGDDNNSTNLFGSGGSNKVEEAAAPKKNFAFIKSKEKDNKDFQNLNTLNSILNLKETESKISTKQAAYQAPNFDIFDSLSVSNASSQKEKFNESIMNSLKDTMPVIDMTKSKNYICIFYF